MKKSFLILFFFFTGFAFSQSEADSLLSELRQAKTDTLKVRINSELGHYWMYKDISKSERYFKAAAALAEKTNIDFYKAIACTALGRLNFCKSNYKQAIEMFRLSNTFLKKENELAIAKNHFEMASAFSDAGYKDSFFVYAFKAAKLFEKHKDDEMLAKVYSNIGLVCVYMQKYNDAKKYLFLSAAMSKKTGNKNAYARCLQNIGVLYENLSKVDSALYYYTNSLELKKESADSNGMISSYTGIANMNFEKKNFQAFKSYIRKACDLAFKLKKMNSYANCIRNLGEGLFSEGQYDSSIYYLKKAQQIFFKTHDLAELLDCYQYLAECNNAKGNYSEAYNLHKLYSVYKDSVLNENTNKQIETIKTEFETEKKEKENQLLQTQNQLSTETIHQQKITTYFVISGLFLALLLAFFIFRGLRQQRIANVIISQQKHLVEEKQKEIIDSIRYAKRIQQSLLPTEKYIERKLKKK